MKPEPLLTEAEVAEILRLSPITLRKLRWRGEPILSFLKIGRSVRYEPNEVAAALKRMRVPAAAEGPGRGK